MKKCRKINAIPNFPHCSVCLLTLFAGLGVGSQLMAQIESAATRDQSDDALAITNALSDIAANDNSSTREALKSTSALLQDVFAFYNVKLSADSLSLAKVVASDVLDKQKIISADKDDLAGYSYWVSYCIAESVRRKPLNTRQLDEIDESLQRILNVLVKAKTDQILAHVSVDRQANAKALVDRRMAEIKAKVSSLMKLLRDDPAYPGMKRPLSKEDEKAIMDDLGGSDDIPVYGKSKTLMVTSDEEFEAKLADFFDSFQGNCIFYIACDPLYRQLLDIPCWGRMLITMHRRDEGKWPMSVFLKPDQNYNKAYNWSRGK